MIEIGEIREGEDEDVGSGGGRGNRLKWVFEKVVGECKVGCEGGGCEGCGRREKG